MDGLAWDNLPAATPHAHPRVLAVALAALALAALAQGD